MTHGAEKQGGMTQEELKSAAAQVAELLASAAAQPAAPAPAGGGSRARGLPDELRERFIAVRAALFQRGLFDPVLVRFDSATAPQATNAEIAAQLAAVAASL